MNVTHSLTWIQIVAAVPAAVMLVILLWWNPKALLNNNLYKTEESGYVLGSEKLPKSVQGVTFAGRTLLVAGDEYVERVSGTTSRS
jgi:hypothetical protein